MISQLGNSPHYNQRNQDTSTVIAVPPSDEGRRGIDNIGRALNLPSPSSQNTDAAQHVVGKRRKENSGNQTNTNNTLPRSVGYGGIGNNSNNNPFHNNLSSLNNDEEHHWPVGLGGINNNNITTKRGGFLLDSTYTSSSAPFTLGSITREPKTSIQVQTDNEIALICQENEYAAAEKSAGYFGNMVLLLDSKMAALIKIGKLLLTLPVCLPVLTVLTQSFIRCLRRLYVLIQWSPLLMCRMTSLMMSFMMNLLRNLLLSPLSVTQELMPRLHLIHFLLCLTLRSMVIWK